MALDGERLGTNITNAIIHSAAPADVKDQVLALWKKIGTEIVKEITANAVVPAGISVSTSGSPTAQTGTTTATGKVS